MSASRTLWLDHLKALSERRKAILERYEPRLTWGPWAKDALQRDLARISAEEAALWGMNDDLEVLVRKSVGAPRAVYHLADRPCGHARLRGFQHLLEGQARAENLARCVNCDWPATEDLRESA